MKILISASMSRVKASPSALMSTGTSPPRIGRSNCQWPPVPLGNSVAPTMGRSKVGMASDHSINHFVSRRIQAGNLQPESAMPKGTMRIAVLAIGSLVSTLVDAEGLSRAQIEEISKVAEDARDAAQLPALSVSVARDGELWSAAFGKADLEQDVPANRQSMFRTASIGKWFTAT